MKSDSKLKEEIRPMSTREADISMLMPKSFKMKGSNRIHHGFIAQDLEFSNFSNLVYENRGGYKSVAYTELIAVLVHNIQTLTKRVEELERRL